MPSSDAKPNKPYPSFPLTPHPNGQWCKKIRGRVCFFGVWKDPDAAHQEYLVQAADLHAGRQPRPTTVSSDGLTVKEVGNAYLNWQYQKLETGEIGSRWFEDCREIIRDFVKAVTAIRPTTHLRPEDFQNYRSRLAKSHGVHSLTRHISVIRGAFKYAYENDLIDRPVKFGTGFSRPSATQKRKSKNRKDLLHGKRLFTAPELERVISAADGFLLPAVLLGINAGFGNTDCAALPVAALDLDAGVIDYARPKTAVQRKATLWPETVSALRALLRSRPTVGDKATERLVFLTPTGLPVVRQSLKKDRSGGVEKVTNHDSVSSAFAALLKDLGIQREGLGFYTLRHTFRTWADEVKDQHAIHRIMGHTIPGMSGMYVEDISIERLRSVTEHVHQKLFGAPLPIPQ